MGKKHEGLVNIQVGLNQNKIVSRLNYDWDITTLNVKNKSKNKNF
jgi:hypothetical protein